MLSLSLNPKLAQKSSDDKSNQIYQLAGNKHIAAISICPVAFPKTLSFQGLMAEGDIYNYQK